ncbi:MAG: glycerol-3-phosphate acyltransferase [Anaerolineales bacterium]|jgi:glycerol-3-phosphate acyltransferase PlsY
MGLPAVVLIVGAYLIGSIPSAYLAGKWVKGIDLRQYGSGTVSGSMVWEHVARWALFPVGIFDIFKAALPTWVGLELGLGDMTAVAAGIAALVGHNWPLYLGFTGGRGLSPFLGTVFVIYPWGFAWLLAFLAIGFFLGDSAPWALAGLVLLPVFNHVMSGPAVLNLAAAAMVIITLIKRLEANRRPLPEDQTERRKVLLRRFFYDRDIRSHQEWLDRKL